MCADDKIIECYFCQGPNKPTFETYHDLAVHISTSKTGHNGGKRWAAKYLSKPAEAAARRHERSNQVRIPLTDEQAEARESTRRVLSGAEELVTTLCLRCKSPARQHLPVEYVRSPDAWKIKGYHVVNCLTCRTRGGRGSYKRA